MRIKVCFVILAFLFVLTGCENGSSPMEKPDHKESYLGMGGESMTGQISVYVGEDKLLHMYDPVQKENIVLCSKADCIHEPYDETANPDPACDAALNRELFVTCVPVISGKYIYLFGEADLSRGVVYRENLDGSARTRLYTIDYQLGMGNSVYVENQTAYAEAKIPVVSEDNLGGVGTNKSHDLILKIDLESGGTEEISPINEQEFQSVRFLDKKGRQFYFYFSWRVLGKEDKDYSTASEYYKIYCYDMETQKTEQIFDEVELAGLSPVGMTDRALCVLDTKTMEAFEISLADKQKTKVYEPSSEKVMYFVFKDRWIVGDIVAEQFSYLDQGKLVLLPGIIGFYNMMGDYVEYSLQDGSHQAVYGDSFFTDDREVILERGESDGT
ncbi:MAG: hypothetical protein HFG32_12825 [Eubacterium sp.]|jgi:hypothetical protein|nr:hypothetical protein [Eubacterium sp.]